MAVFPTLDFTQIKARYPKGVQRITDWLFEQEELKSATADFIDKKDPEKSKEMFAGLLIQMDPRKLYDIFDSFGILVNVHEYAGDFSYWVRSENGTAAVYTSPTRHQAEQSAFHDAFEILENQLS